MMEHDQIDIQENTVVTVIVPVYNIEDLLERCVASICKQTYRNLEILLVDDGSTDRSGALCDELSAKDDRIRVLHKENGGSSSARNLGIREATGSYVCFIDSDDYIEPFFVEAMLEEAEGNNLVQIGRDELAEDGTSLPFVCQPPGTKTFYNAEAFLKEMLLHKGDASFCTKLVQRSLLLEAAKENPNGAVFPEGELNEDFHLMLQLLPKAGGVISLPQIGYHVWYRMGSNTRKKAADDFSRVYGDNVRNADLAEKLVESKYHALQKISVRFGLYQRLDYLLHIPISRMTRENREYRAIVHYIRTHLWAVCTYPHLTGKNRVYLWLFALCPKGIRVIHKKVRLDRRKHFE